MFGVAFQARTKAEQRPTDDCYYFRPNCTKRNVIRCQILEIKSKMKVIIKYVFSKECPPETKSLTISHALAIFVSLAALVVSLLAF